MIAQISTVALLNLALLAPLSFADGNGSPSGSWCSFDKAHQRIAQYTFSGTDRVTLTFWKKASDTEPTFSEMTFGGPKTGTYTWDPTKTDFTIDYQFAHNPWLSHMRWAADGRLQIQSATGYPSFCQCRDVEPADCSAP
jgi:hypothetical protein